MSRLSKLLIYLLLFCLAGCNFPLGTNGTQPAATEKSLPSQPDPSDTPDLSPTAEIEETDTTTPETIATGEPVPTVDMTQALQGTPIPLYPAGTEISLRDIQMVDANGGWALGGRDGNYYHLFLTRDGGFTWQDVTPPQPVNQNVGFINAEYGVWDADTAWVAYNNANYVWSTDNGGVSWQASPLVFETTIDGIFDALDQDQVWFFQFLEGGMQRIITSVNRSSDGGGTWELLLDPYDDATIQAFDKTGVAFISPTDGWLTRDFRGVDPYVGLNWTKDGGINWDLTEIPPPPPLPTLFQNGLAGLYDPYLSSQGEGHFRLFTRHFEDEEMIDRDFLYKTSDQGANWEILDMPSGDLYTVSEDVLFAISRDIYLSEDGGGSWQLVKSVNWDGQFSFIDRDTALAIAHMPGDLYDPEDDRYALVKTSNGCGTFEIIIPQVLPSPSER